MSSQAPQQSTSCKPADLCKMAACSRQTRNCCKVSASGAVQVTGLDGSASSWGPIMWEVLTRRDTLLSTGLMFMLARAGTADAAPGDTMSDPANQDRVARSATRVRGFADPEMDFQLLRSLGVANSMGGAVGEIFAAVRDIRDSDPRTWPPAFVALGDQTRSVARSVLQKHPVSARHHFQRASMYYRAAEYYDDPVTPTSRAHGLASRDAFLEAAKLT